VRGTLSTLCVLTLAGALFLPATVVAQPAARDSATPSGASEADQEAYWRARSDEARQRVEAARARVASAEESYGNMRHRSRKRGEPRAIVSDERTAAHSELEAALKYLEEELPEEARRAGALPGWLRE
jgi:hypothetical protein